MASLLESCRWKEQVREIEQRILRTEQDLAAMEEELASPETYKDPALAAEKGKRYNALKEKLDELYEQWDGMA